MRLEKKSTYDVVYYANHTFRHTIFWDVEDKRTERKYQGNTCSCYYYRSLGAATEEATRRAAKDLGSFAKVTPDVAIVVT